LILTHLNLVGCDWSQPRRTRSCAKKQPGSPWLSGFGQSFIEHFITERDFISTYPDALNDVYRHCYFNLLCYTYLFTLCHV